MRLICRQDAARFATSRVGMFRFVLAGIAFLALVDATTLAADDGPPTNRPSRLPPPQDAARPAQVARPSDPAAASAADVRAASFKDITPGKTPLIEIKRTLGVPARQFEHEGETTLRYIIPPFSKVDVVVADGVCSSVVIYLEKPTAHDELTRELGLNDFRPTSIVDEQGAVLGQVFPERGVLFGYAPDSKQKVAQILLEPIGAEPFLARVEQSHNYSYQQNLADLHYAIQLEPGNARAHHLLARLLLDIGRYRDALNSAQRAAELDPRSATVRLTKAQVLRESGDHVRALQETQAALALEDILAEEKARGECLLGDLTASGTTPDFKQAMEHHLAAIKLASPLAIDPRVAVRRAAKKVLIEAHLAVAMDVAAGSWKRKPEVVPKWLDRARELAENVIKDEQGGEHLRLIVTQASLAAFEQFRGAPDPTEVTQSSVEEGRKLFAASSDPLFHARIQHWMAATLFHTAKVQYLRREYDTALEYADASARLLSESGKSRELTPVESYRMGQSHFIVGSVHAVHRNDHREAVTWFDKADSLLRNPLPASETTDAVNHAERFVSMGVSYWHVDARERALDVTLHGVKQLEKAVRDGLADESALAIPYGNLASMQRHLGHEQDARQYAEKAASLEVPAAQSERR